LLKVIWIQAASPVLVADPFTVTTHNRLTEFAR